MEGGLVAGSDQQGWVGEDGMRNSCGGCAGGESHVTTLVKIRSILTKKLERGRTDYLCSENEKVRST